MSAAARRTPATGGIGNHVGVVRLRFIQLKRVYGQPPAPRNPGSEAGWSGSVPFQVAVRGHPHVVEIGKEDAPHLEPVANPGAVGEEGPREVGLHELPKTGFVAL